MLEYDKSLMDTFILYLDTKILYGYAMCEYLPKWDFKWNTEEWTVRQILNLDDEEQKGYLFVVNIHSPEHLHDTHNGYARAYKSSY